EFNSKTAHIARRVRRSLVSGDGREPHKHGRFFPGPLKNVGPGDFGQRLISLKETVSSIAAGMHNPFRSARDRNGRSFPEDESLREASVRARRRAVSSGRPKLACPAGSSA